MNVRIHVSNIVQDVKFKENDIPRSFNSKREELSSSSTTTRTFRKQKRSE